MDVNKIKELLFSSNLDDVALGLVLLEDNSLFSKNTDYDRGWVSNMIFEINVVTRPIGHVIFDDHFYIINSRYGVILYIDTVYYIENSKDTIVYDYRN